MIDSKKENEILKDVFQRTTDFLNANRYKKLIVELHTDHISTGSGWFQITKNIIKTHKVITLYRFNLNGNRGQMSIIVRSTDKPNYGLKVEKIYSIDELRIEDKLTELLNKHPYLRVDGNIND